MHLFEDIAELLKEPLFQAGILFGLFVWLVLKCFWKMFSRKKTESDKNVTTLIDKCKKGEYIDLDSEFPPEGRKDRTTTGYRAWKAMAYWLANTYADYQYTRDNAEAFWSLVGVCFGESAAYRKMRALDEIINRSTKYYTKNGMPYDRAQDQSRDELYKMVDLIVDSFDPQVYEGCRTDNKQQ